MKSNRFLCYLFLVMFFSVQALFAQPAQKLVRITVAPEHADWNYRIGEKVRFHIAVTQYGNPVQGAKVRYELSEDMMPAFKKGEAVLKEGTLTVDAGTLAKPGFIRCRVHADVNGNGYDDLATAAIEPEKITPTAVMPDDFMSFWEAAKAENAKLPLDACMTLMPERCTGKVDVYHVSFQNLRYGSRIYGILCVPKAPGKYPAVLSVPGAGIRPYAGAVNEAERHNIITLQIGIHGIPVNLPTNFYDELAAGALNNYPYIRLDDRYEYYYKRVYLGCVRAVDFIFSLDRFDGENLCVEGGSQGGALSIVTAALDPRVKGLVAYYPALCDLEGYTHGRAGGWPHMFSWPTDVRTRPAQIETARYYDVVNFARILKTPGFYTMGYNDMVCPPTSTLSAYNVITAPKELMLVPETEHYAYPEQWSSAWEWLVGRLAE